MERGRAENLAKLPEIEGDDFHLSPELINGAKAFARRRRRRRHRGCRRMVGHAPVEKELPQVHELTMYSVVADATKLRDVKADERAETAR